MDPSEGTMVPASSADEPIASTGNSSSIADCVLPIFAGSQASQASQAPSEDASAIAADTGEIDGLLELIDQTSRSRSNSQKGGSDGDDKADVDELLNCLGAGPGSPLVSRLSPRLSPVLSPGDKKTIGEIDLPEPTCEPPPEVMASISIFAMIAKFNLKTDVDLRKLAFAVKHAEFNPRKHGSITIRLLEPRATALVRATGSVSITGVVVPEELKLAAKKIARLVQKSGHDAAKFAGYQVITMSAKTRLGHPIRLDNLAAKWRKFALYEPELYCGCVFRTNTPRVTYLLTSGGHVSVNGTRSLEEVREAVRRIHPILQEFKT